MSEPRRRPATRPAAAAERPGERLQKVLAAAGFGSRRHCEEFILEGRVTVDGEVVTELGVRVEPGRQQIVCDGKPVLVEKKVFYAVNKPTGVISTNDDPRGRPRVIDLLGATRERLYPIGRLDEDSQGLILVTNHGELAHRLAHPRYGVTKTYRVLVAGLPSEQELQQLRDGLEFSDGLFRVHFVKRLRNIGASTLLEIVLAEGQNREIRRLLARIGHKVMRLERIAFGPIRLGKLRTGQSRRLTRAEVTELRDAAGLGTVKPKKRPAGRRGRAPGTPAQGQQAAVKSAGPRPKGRRLAGNKTADSQAAGRAPEDRRPEGAAAKGRPPRGAGRGKSGAKASN